MKNIDTGSEGWGCLALMLGFLICLAVPPAFAGQFIPLALLAMILLGVALILTLIGYATSKYEGARERVQLRKEERERERARFMMPLQAALRSTNPGLQAVALSAVQEYGFTQAALEEVYQTYTFDQLLASAEPARKDSSIDLEKPE